MKGKYWFFGSKLNTVLLLILIILMIIALRWMYQNKDVYFPSPKQSSLVDKVTPLTSPQIEGNKNDLVSFSVKSGQEVSGKMQVTGSIKGGYFFEANILVNILDTNKKLLKSGHGTATGDWMTSDPVSFKADLDFTGLPKGGAYIEIHNDNASGLPENDKSILVPIVIK